jgi:tripartite-type tricarboxylate transporter receptor subunit TctC
MSHALRRSAAVWRGVFVCAAAATAGNAMAADAVATYPSKAVRFIVPVAAGAGPDTTGRVLAAKLTALWRQPVVVENRPGATGAIGVELTANAPPDGYTLCLISGSQAVNSAVNAKLPYDLARDLQGISQVSSLPYAVYANTGVPATTLRELIVYAKAHPGKLNYASSGAGGLQHLAGELFAQKAQVKLTHVAFKGTAAGILALVGGEIQLGFSTLLGVRPYAAGGRLRIFAVTAKKRLPDAAETPTVAETLPGYEVDQWYGLVVAAKTAPALVNKINAAVVGALQSPDVIARLGADGSTPVGSSAERFSSHLKTEILKWRKLANDVNLVLQ